jgi:hypothetical protein
MYTSPRVRGALPWVEIMRCRVVKTIEEALELLKQDPNSPVRTELGGLVIEVRAVTESPSERSAAQVFAEVGPWAGETTEEILAILAEARGHGGRRSVPEL